MLVTYLKRFWELTRRHAHTIWVVVAAVFCGLVVFFPLTNSDIWWHLAAGREMLVRKAFLRTDPFSFTSTGASWLDLHWLFQLLVFAIYRIGGVAGLVWGKSLLFGATCGLLFYAHAGRRDYAVGSGILCLLMFQVRFLVLARPVVLTLLLCAAFLFCLERFRTGGRWWYLFPLLPAQIVWTNSQGLFALGVFIAWAYVVGMIAHWGMDGLRGQVRSPARGRREMMLLPAVPVALVLVCFVNPYGLEGVLFPLRLFGRIDPSVGNIYAENVTENAPLMSLLGREPGMVYTVFVTAGLALLAMALDFRRIRVEHILILGGFFMLAYMAKRNILLFLFMTAPILSYHAAGIGRNMLLTRLEPSIRTLLRTVVVLLVMIAIAARARGHVEMLRLYPEKDLLSPFRYPRGAVAYLKQHPVEGNVFNSVRNGGYLLWKLYPPQQVFIDGRLIIRTPRFFADYLSVLDEPEVFDSVADRFGVTHVVLPTELFYTPAPYLYMPLIRKLYHDRNWSLVYTDGTSVLFVDSSRAPTPALELHSVAHVKRVAKMLRIRWRRDPYLYKEACFHLGHMLQNLDEHETARWVFEELERATGGRPEVPKVSG